MEAKLKELEKIQNQITELEKKEQALIIEIKSDQLFKQIERLTDKSKDTCTTIVIPEISRRWDYLQDDYSIMLNNTNDSITCMKYKIT